MDIKPDINIEEKEMKTHLSELYEKLNTIPIIRIDRQEKFDLFRSYYRGYIDGIITGLHTVGFKGEYIPDAPSKTEDEINRFIDDVEYGTRFAHKDFIEIWDYLGTILRSEYIPGNI